ncbi:MULTISPECIES: hypothetical protein [Protofrankia]|uniref:Uncharacterized protein n=1 Tax=Candidatus Protofrankia datiscae TaxID=2716812 RepID=F8AWZ8_9ACTN|nr:MULTISPECIES: hypothetical protein [Protofrankia]AEH11444.1 hypothetical protein FsymDg_4179 [Candidatus Protofrankia datiscae]
MARSGWDQSQWIDYDAYVLNVFAGGSTAWIEYRYTIGYVGWRRIYTEPDPTESEVLTVATAAKASGRPVRVRVTNSSGPGGTAEIVAMQTL